MSREVDELQREVDALASALEATGYEGLLHETRRSAMSVALLHPRLFIYPSFSG